MSGIDRRTMLAGLGALAAAGCTSTVVPDAQPEPRVVAGRIVVPPEVAAMYAARPDERFPIPAVDLSKIEPQFWRREVPDPTGEPPNTIVVDTTERFLYLTLGNGRAMRYGVGLGRQGFSWDGVATIRLKREWPTWTPPDEMIARDPELEKYRDGMPPSLANPLGARALYLFQGGQDTLYRLHGTQEAYSIGRAVSSGCVRLLNQDVIDLYDRTPLGARVIVLPPGTSVGA